MTHRTLVFAVAALGVILIPQPAGAQAAGQQQEPRFRSTVEVTSIDVAVVDGQGKPLSSLTPAEFAVRVDGKNRRVVTAEWVPLSAGGAAAAKPPPDLPIGYSSNENASGGRLIAIAVDEPHIRPGGAAAVLAAASSFIDRLAPTDRVAAVSLGVGGNATPFVADRERVKSALGRMAGQRQSFKATNSVVSEAEALEIADGNRMTADRVTSRECANLRPSSAQFLQCRQEVELEAAQVVDQLRQSSSTTIKSLRDLLGAIQVLDGPKTLILMSEGFAIRDPSMMNELGSLAAATRTSIYAMRLDNQLFEATNSARPVIDQTTNAHNDALESLAAAARGALFNVTGTGNQLFASIESELSGYYLLGVESDPTDRDGKPHTIRIDVSRRGATVRTRRQLLNVPADLARPRSLREAVAASLTAPLLMSALPLRVGAFAVRGPEQSKIQLLIRADVGDDYTTPRPAVIGYVILDRTGKVVESRTVVASLAPAMNGVPGALQFSGGASLDAGDYMIKVAVAEGDRVGSVEHPVHASLVDLGEISLSELLVGGPADTTDLLHPTVGYRVSFGSVHGYFEAYGPHLDQVAAKYEIAAAEDGPALLVSDVPPRPTGSDRALFTQMIPVNKLPPGHYFLRAHVTSSGEPIKSLSRAFEIAPPAVLMTSASGAAPAAARSTTAPNASADLFLPIEEGLMSGKFGREDALKQANLEAFLKRVPEATKPAFEEGVAELRKPNYPGAEASFKRAIRPDVDSTSAMTYLAATMAAAGHDPEAAAAWQTALIDGSDLPQIYEWLGDALVRTRDFSGARSILEEAAGRWPSDTRFDRSLAICYATLGRGRDALRVLERYVSDNRQEPDLLMLGVDWIFQAHNNGTVVFSRAADLALARKFADQYAQANGPKQALVQQWLAFLANEKP
jgi:VWFA-related protein